MKACSLQDSRTPADLLPIRRLREVLANTVKVGVRTSRASTGDWPNHYPKVLNFADLHYIRLRTRTDLLLNRICLKVESMEPTMEPSTPKLSTNELRAIVLLSLYVCEGDEYVSETEIETLWIVVNETFKNSGVSRDQFDAYVEAYFESGASLDDISTSLPSGELRAFALQAATVAAGSDGLDPLEKETWKLAKSKLGAA